MKKLRFAIMVIVLAAAFPVLFIAGINGPKSKTKDVDAEKTIPVSNKSQAEVNNITLQPFSLFTPKI